MLHVGRKVGSDGYVVPGSVQAVCIDCGCDVWIDPRACLEIHAGHVHVCHECGRPSDEDEVLIPRSALRALEAHLRRN